MYRTYHRHPHRSSHGLHHLRRMPATAIRYPRSRLSPRHMMMRRPIFYPPPPPVKSQGCWDILLSILAALFCININRGGMRVVPGGGVGGGFGRIITAGGGVTSGGGGVTIGGGGGYSWWWRRRLR
ncbi:unnamed protein product [Rotaria sp. Silwood2]|nr:unnamed protein product [Rotaria sp. Silwood2]